MISLHHFIVDINFKKNFDLKTNPINSVGLSSRHWINIYHQSLTSLLNVNNYILTISIPCFALISSTSLHLIIWMVLTGTCLYLLTAPGFVHVCFMSAFYAFQALRVIWMCLHGKRHSKTLSPLSHKPSGKTLVRSSYVSWGFLRNESSHF